MAEPTPARVKRSLYRGDTRVWTHVFTDSETTDPIDISGWEFVSEYRVDLDRGTVICEATCEVTDGPAGVLTETLTAEQADLLPGQPVGQPKSKVYWDLQSTDLDGNVQTWQQAVVPVSGDASNV